MIEHEPERVKEVFNAALLQPEHERDAFVRDQCQDDEPLRSQVAALLGAHARTNAFLETPALGVDLRLEEIARRADPDAGVIGESISCYVLTSVIASGGMGTVYEARHKDTSDVVALKMIRPGIASPGALRRFEHEARVLARLDHEGIARIYEAGTYDDNAGPVPFFAMEFVADAQRITDYAEAHKLTVASRLELFAKVCDAAHHGHQKGIIHRDLKPSNILVGLAGHPKIIDFGVARAIDSDLVLTTVHTGAGQLLGTVQYMSPEQCQADPDDLDIRSDIYSLGVVFFELVYGALPYDLTKAPLHDGVRIVQEQNPAIPSTARALPGELRTIALKALEKERERRYQSASEFAADIRRHLKHEPILARPPSTLYQFRKFAKRNRLTVGVSLVAVGLLIAGTAVSATLAIGQTRSAREARIEAAKAEQISWFLQDMLAGIDPDFAQGADTQLLRRILDETEQRIETDLAGQPEVEASIRSTIGNTYRIIGEYEQAETHLTVALELRRVELGDLHPDTLDSVYRLGELCYEAGQFERAEGLLLEALAGQRRVLGEEDPATSLSLGLLGSLYRILGRLDDAEPIYLQTLEYRRRVLGDEHFDTIVAMNNVAALYFSKGEYEEARRRFEDLLRVTRRVFGEENETTVMARFNLAAQLVELGRFDDAEPLSREVVDIRRRVLGPMHPDTLFAMTQLGDLYREMERYEDAAPLLEDAVKFAKESMPQGHWLIGYFLSRRGILLRDVEEYEVAEMVLLEAHEILEAAFGPDHRRVLGIARTIAKLYDAWGKPEQAEQWRVRLAEG